MTDAGTDCQPAGHLNGMHRKRFLLCLPLVTSVGACDLGNKPIGEVEFSETEGSTASTSGSEGEAEGGSGTGMSPTTDGSPPGTSEESGSGEASEGTGGTAECLGEIAGFGFDLSGVPEQTEALSATCSAAVNEQVVSLTDCNDPSNAPVDDLTLTLSGDWAGPLPAALDILDGESVTLRYVEWDPEILSRWLVVGTPQFPQAIVAIDAIQLSSPASLPGGTLDYGPIAMQAQTLDCPEFEGPTCARERLAVTVTYEGDERTIAHGTQISDLGGAGGGTSTQYVVTVGHASQPIAETCAGPSATFLRVGLVAYPNS